MRRRRAASVVVIDDLDALAARFPHDYAAELTERLERFVRGAGDRGILVVAAARGSRARRHASLTCCPAACS